VNLLNFEGKKSQSLWHPPPLCQPNSWHVASVSRANALFWLKKKMLSDPCYFDNHTLSDVFGLSALKLLVCSDLQGCPCLAVMKQNPWLKGFVPSDVNTAPVSNSSTCHHSTELPASPSAAPPCRFWCCGRRKQRHQRHWLGPTSLDTQQTAAWLDCFPCDRRFYKSGFLSAVG
jgi:hypothetical protein